MRCNKHFMENGTGFIIKPGESYRHFETGITYKVLFIGTQLTDYHAKTVVCQCDPTDDNVILIPYEMFNCKIDKSKYPNTTKEFILEKVEY